MQLLTFGWLSLEWINTLIFFDLILDARYPNTNSIESITLDLPLPFGPTIDEKFYNNDDTHINRWRNATTNGQVHFLHSLFLLLTVIHYTLWVIKNTHTMQEQQYLVWMKLTHVNTTLYWDENLTDVTLNFNNISRQPIIYKNRNYIQKYQYTT